MSETSPGAERPAALKVLGESWAEPRFVTLGSGESAIFSRKSPLKSSEGNEDCAAIVPLSERASVFIVADGVGGAPDGDRASQLAVSALCECLEACREDTTFTREAILQGFALAEHRIRQMEGEAATTLMVVELIGRIARTYHTGDSQALVITPDGGLRWRTLPHSPVGYAVEAGILDERDAMFSPQRHLVSNVVGNGVMKVEMSRDISMGVGDTILLGSDGIFDNFFENELIDQFSGGGELKTATEKLVTEVDRRMRCPADGVPSKPDDATLVGFRLVR